MGDQSRAVFFELVDGGLGFVRLLCQLHLHLAVRVEDILRTARSKFGCDEVLTRNEGEGKSVKIDFVTLLALKSLNRSVKSELTNIETFHPGIMNNQFPGRIEARRRRLGLPKTHIKSAIQITDFPFSLYKICTLHR